MSQIHAKTDKLSLVAVPEKDGKMRVTSRSWGDPPIEWVTSGGIS
jgi:hypothetical protein